MAEMVGRFSVAGMEVSRDRWRGSYLTGGSIFGSEQDPSFRERLRRRHLAQLMDWHPMGRMEVARLPDTVKAICCIAGCQRPSRLGRGSRWRRVALVFGSCPLDLASNTSSEVSRRQFCSSSRCYLMRPETNRCLCEGFLHLYQAHGLGWATIDPMGVSGRDHSVCPRCCLLGPQQTRRVWCRSRPCSLAQMVGWGPGVAGSLWAERWSRCRWLFRTVLTRSTSMLLAQTVLCGIGLGREDGHLGNRFKEASSGRQLRCHGALDGSISSLAPLVTRLSQVLLHNW